MRPSITLVVVTFLGVIGCAAATQQSPPPDIEVPSVEWPDLVPSYCHVAVPVRRGSLPCHCHRVEHADSGKSAGPQVDPGVGCDSVSRAYPSNIPRMMKAEQ